jgi:hypothetical protein
MASELKRAKAKVMDMTDVKERGPFNPVRQESGDYLAKIVDVFETDSKAGDPMWVFAVQLDEQKSAVYPMYCLLNPDNFWKIRMMCVATGMAIPKKRIKIEPAKLIGKMIGISLEDDEYDGKMKSVIDKAFPKSELGGKADDEDIDDDDVDDEDEDDDEPEPPKKSKKAPAKKSKKKAAPVEEDDDEDEDEEDDDEDDEDEEEEVPVKKKAAGKKVKGSTKVPAKKAKAKKKAKVEDDDDDDVDDDDLDELDVDDI